MKTGRILLIVLITVLAAPIAWTGWTLIHDASTSTNAGSDRLGQLSGLAGSGPSVAVDAPLPPMDDTAIAHLVATVPRLVVVRLNSAGNPTQVLTNTGEPPVGDEELVAVRDGRQVSVASELLASIMRHHYKGDWSVPGVWHKW